MPLTLIDLAILAPCALGVLAGATIIIAEAIDMLGAWLDAHHGDR